MNTYIYDFEVFMYDWVVVFRNVLNNEEIVVHNDNIKLLSVLSHCNCLIGFNNYNYDDVILYNLLKKNLLPYELFEISQEIVNNTSKRLKLQNLNSIDLMQELPLGLSLKEIECNLGLNIEESTVNWNIKRKLNKEELEQIIYYCKHDVYTTSLLYKLREDYVQAKKDLIEEFQLPLSSIKNTRAVITSDILKSQPVKFNDRLNISYIAPLKLENIPKSIIEFYNNCKNDFLTKKESYRDIEKRSYTYNFKGVDLQFGFGGLHGARNGYIRQDKILYLDFNSFYPSLMIKYDMLSRSCKQKDLYKNIYDTRFKLKAKGEVKEYIYKILLNGTFGATKFEYNKMFDPLQANNICVNGQLILMDLIVRLSKYGDLIQANTDGVMFETNDEVLEDMIKIKEDFEKEYDLKLGMDFVSEIYQRDVNNYILKKENGKIEGKGRFKNWNKNKVNYSSYNLAIIDIALYEYYINKIPIRTTINDLILSNNYLPFQLVCKKSSKYDGLAHYVNGEMQEFKHKVYRVFASVDKKQGIIFKRKNNLYEKYANSPNNTFIHNDKIENLDFKKLDLDYYERLCMYNLIENMTKKKNYNKVFIPSQVSLFELM